MSSQDHYDTMKAYKEMGRQDSEAAKTGTVPHYQRSGTVNINSSHSSGGSTTSNAGQNSSSGQRK